VNTILKGDLGQCKLCLKVKRLHESHLMPRALYSPGRKGIRYATRSQFGVNPEHIKAHLLCFDCEQHRIPTRYGHHGHRMLGDYTRQFWTAPSTDVVYNCLGFEFIARGVYFRGLMGHHLLPMSPGRTI
jgi:hypothetical protein